MTASFGLPMTMSGDVAETAEISFGPNDHTAAIPAAAPVGTSARNLRLASKAATAVPAVSGPTKDGYLVDKHVLKDRRTLNK